MRMRQDENGFFCLVPASESDISSDKEILIEEATANFLVELSKMDKGSGAENDAEEWDSSEEEWDSSDDGWVSSDC